MIVTVRNYSTNAPIENVSVSVDGGSPSTTDSSGQVTCPDGNTVRVPGAGTFVFTDPGDREIWMEAASGPPSSTSGGGLMP